MKSKEKDQAAEAAWKLRKNVDAHSKVRKITDAVRNGRLTFFGHAFLTHDNRLTERILGA